MTNTKTQKRFLTILLSFALIIVASFAFVGCDLGGNSISTDKGDSGQSSSGNNYQIYYNAEDIKINVSSDFKKLPGIQNSTLVLDGLFVPYILWSEDAGIIIEIGRWHKSVMPADITNLSQFAYLQANTNYASAIIYDDDNKLCFAASTNIFFDKERWYFFKTTNYYYLVTISSSNDVLDKQYINMVKSITFLNDDQIYDVDKTAAWYNNREHDYYFKDVLGFYDSQYDSAKKKTRSCFRVTPRVVDR